MGSDSEQNQEQYLKVLNGGLLPFKQQMEANRDSTSMPRNLLRGFSPVETSPLKSPDIHSIENGWIVLKQNIYERQNTTKKILTQNIREVCFGNPFISESESCVQSRPHRNNVGWTKY